MTSDPMQSQLDGEREAKKLLILNDDKYVILAIQLRIAKALEKIANILEERNS